MDIELNAFTYPAMLAKVNASKPTELRKLCKELSEIGSGKPGMPYAILCCQAGIKRLRSISKMEPTQATINNLSYKLNTFYRCDLTQLPVIDLNEYFCGLSGGWYLESLEEIESVNNLIGLQSMKVPNLTIKPSLNALQAIRWTSESKAIVYRIIENHLGQDAPILAYLNKPDPLTNPSNKIDILEYNLLIQAFNELKEEYETTNKKETL